MVLLPFTHSIYLKHFFLCRHVIKDKVWEALSEGEARCLMKKAVKSGNVAMFDKAKEAVLLRGKVRMITISGRLNPRRLLINSTVKIHRQYLHDILQTSRFSLSDLLPDVHMA